MDCFALLAMTILICSFWTTKAWRYEVFYYFKTWWFLNVRFLIPFNYVNRLWPWIASLCSQWLFWFVPSFAVERHEDKYKGKTLTIWHTELWLIKPKLHPARPDSLSLENLRVFVVQSKIQTIKKPAREILVRVLFVSNCNIKILTFWELWTTTCFA